MANQKVSAMTKVPTLTGGMKIALGLQEAGIGNYATDPDQIKDLIESGARSFENNTETTKTLPAVSKTYFYTGAGTGTWTMYAVSGNDGIRIEIKNLTAFNLTVQRAGADNLYDSATTTSVVIGPGECWQIMCNGTYHVIMKS